ncbi:MAG: site-specific integrase, partial [Candidatus Krumholzibacteria bacterium]|nr:site-specific integrase [Candidatus Krumholzibacteria bacterium]
MHKRSQNTSTKDKVSPSILNRLAESYIDHLAVEKGLSPLSIKAYTADLKDYFKFLRAAGIKTPDGIDLES